MSSLMHIDQQQNGYLGNKVTALIPFSGKTGNTGCDGSPQAPSRRPSFSTKGPLRWR
jgi:hypothetical protein